MIVLPGLKMKHFLFFHILCISSKIECLRQLVAVVNSQDNLSVHILAELSSVRM